MSSFTLKCPTCGGSTVLNPETGKLECKQCGNQFGAYSWGEKNSAMVENEDGELVDKRSYKSGRKLARIRRYITDSPNDDIYSDLYSMDEINLGNAERDEDSPKYMEMNLYECTSCGAKLMVKSTETSSFCAYCGQPMILIDRLENELEPDLIIPFGISQKRAEHLIREKFCQGWFVPNEIKNFQLDKIRGIYVPYWLISYHVKKKIKYVFSDSPHNDKESSHSRLIDLLTKNSRRRGDEVVIHNCMKDAECIVSRIPGDASRRLNDNISSRLEPYDIDRAMAFTPEYLAGFYTDRYDVSAREVAVVAKKKSDKALHDEMIHEVGKNLRVTDEQTEIKLEDVEYALFPAWFMTFRYQGIIYTVAVNGQTGKVVGNVPSNRFKVGASIAILMTLMVLICTFASVFMGNLIVDMSVVDAETEFYVIGAYIFLVANTIRYFWKAVNKLHRSRIDINRFRSYGTIEYVKERQDKTWVR